jgi:hypothetical protein
MTARSPIGKASDPKDDSTLASIPCAQELGDACHVEHDVVVPLIVPWTPGLPSHEITGSVEEAGTTEERRRRLR